MSDIVEKPRLRVNARTGRVMGYSSAYNAASRSGGELAAWNPRIASADAEIIPSRDKIVARARDLVRNNGWADAGVDSRADAVVGTNIRLDAKPDFKLMGQTPEWADEWSQNVEAWFRTWANDPRLLCDLERSLNFGGMVRLAYQHYVVDGEACAPIYSRDRGGPFMTTVLILDPDRLGNPDGQADSETLRGGVRLDSDGAPIGYYVRNAHPTPYGTTIWSDSMPTYFPRETPDGRPQFVHVFNKKRAHQRRGMSRLASVMKRFKMLDRYDDAEVAAALLNAVLGAVVTSPHDPSIVQEALAPTGDEGSDAELSAYQSERLAFHEQGGITLNGVQVTHLFPGEDLKMLDPKRPNANFPAFEAAVLRSVAGALGLSYEQLSRDWSQINYSSARTLLNEIWRGFLADRQQFTQLFCTPIYAAVLEEMIARGYVKIPGRKLNFYKWRAALTQCVWVGPGRGYIDPKKEAEAAGIRMGLGISTLQRECAEQGEDWRDNLWDKKRAQELAEEYGVSLGTISNVDATDPEMDHDGEGVDPDREGDGKFKGVPGAPDDPETNEGASE